jgi:L-fucose mutarotase/ribose pyranase (RbsD/FucU family)
MNYRRNPLDIARLIISSDNPAVIDALDTFLVVLELAHAEDFAKMENQRKKDQEAEAFWLTQQMNMHNQTQQQAAIAQQNYLRQQYAQQQAQHQVLGQNAFSIFSQGLF